jgi:hypothetical protein
MLMLLPCFFQFFYCSSSNVSTQFASEHEERFFVGSLITPDLAIRNQRAFSPEMFKNIGKFTGKLLYSIVDFFGPNPVFAEDVVKVRANESNNDCGGKAIDCFSEFVHALATCTYILTGGAIAVMGAIIFRIFITTKSPT